MEARIRLATTNDAPAIQAIYAPVVEHTIISFETISPSVSEMAARITATLAARPWLVCEIGGHVAGYAYAAGHRERAAYRWCVEPSVYVGEGFRRRGVAEALYTALLSALSAQGFYNAYAGIALPNEASVALHERMGFTPVGVYEQIGHKHGAWHSVGWWQRSLREDRSAPPAEALAMDALLALPAWESALRRGTARLR